MKIGYACTPIMIQNKTTRKITVGNYSEEKLLQLIKNNLEDLYSILVYNKSNGIELFRISSDIIPLGSHEINTVEWWDIFKSQLSEIGQYIIDNNLRVSMHPGQYTLLNSPKEDVLNKSILDLTYHCRFLDSLEISSIHKIILHVGGCYGDKDAAILRFIDTYKKLPKNIKDRLIIENDERFFSIYDLLKIHKSIEVPIIFDNLHYKCYGDFSKPLAETLAEVQRTWLPKDGPMKIHYSQQDTTKKSGAHAPTTSVSLFFSFLKEYDFSNIDIMLEVKDKDVSALKINNSINHINDSSTIILEVQRYELFVLQTLGDAGLTKLLAFTSVDDIVQLYNFIDSLIYINYNDEYFKKALNKAFSIITENLNSKEIDHYNKIYNQKEYVKCKEYLKKLSDKYGLSLNNTYYFVY